MGLRHDPIYAFAADPTIDEDADAGYVVGDDWVNTSTDAIWMCTDNSNGAAVWRNLSDILNAPGGAKSMVLSFASGSSKHVSTNSPTYESLAHLVYAGSDAVGPILEFNLNAWVSMNTGDVRVYDLTSGLEIAELAGISGTAESTVGDMGAISNLPTGPAVFEVQGKKNGGATVFIASLELEY